MPGGAPKGHENRREHGLYSVAKHGAERLPAELRDREVELLQNLATFEGVMAEAERQAAHQVLIVETGVLHLRQIIADGRNPWTSGADGRPEPILRILGTYMNGAMRALSKLAELRNDANTVDLDDLLGREVGNADDSG
jgi:hypothetical protein